MSLHSHHERGVVWPETPHYHPHPQQEDCPPAAPPANPRHPHRWSVSHAVVRLGSRLYDPSTLPIPIRLHAVGFRPCQYLLPPPPCFPLTLLQHLPRPVFRSSHQTGSGTTPAADPLQTGIVADADRRHLGIVPRVGGRHLSQVSRGFQFDANLRTIASIHPGIQGRHLDGYGIPLPPVPGGTIPCRGKHPRRHGQTGRRRMPALSGEDHGHGHPPPPPSRPDGPGSTTTTTNHNNHGRVVLCALF